MNKKPEGLWKFSLPEWARQTASYTKLTEAQMEGIRRMARGELPERVKFKIPQEWERPSDKSMDLDFSKVEARAMSSELANRRMEEAMLGMLVSGSELARTMGRLREAFIEGETKVIIIKSRSVGMSIGDRFNAALRHNPHLGFDIGVKLNNQIQSSLLESILLRGGHFTDGSGRMEAINRFDVLPLQHDRMYLMSKMRGMPEEETNETRRHNRGPKAVTKHGYKNRKDRYK